MTDAPDGLPLPEVKRDTPFVAALRRCADVLVSLCALLLLAPLMLWISWRIRRDSDGKAIFTQTRAGRDGTPFVIYKFRTMSTTADPYGNSPHSGDDPRLTRYGRRLRESSLDELPQLWNVLRGDMSLVGPRPLYVSQMKEFTPRQMLRLKVKPGLTGLAQVNGRAELTLEDKLELDVQYVLNRSLATDLRIVFRTLLDVIRPGRTGIYEIRYSNTQETRSAGDEPQGGKPSTTDDGHDANRGN